MRWVPENAKWKTWFSHLLKNLPFKSEKTRKNSEEYHTQLKGDRSRHIRGAPDLKESALGVHCPNIHLFGQLRWICPEAA